jgi:hypothetical protein
MNASINCVITLSIVLGLAACSQDPKVITEKENDANVRNSGIFTGDSMTAKHTHNSQPIGENIHTVVALESLPAARYVYVRVREGSEEFWIATNRQEIKPGGTYFYRDGLLKTNFESKEHNKTFDTLYFVSKMVTADHGQALRQDSNHTASAVTGQPVNRAGTLKISDLVANPKKYAGKTVQVGGTCVKLNADIMGRNWIHLDDGSTRNFDLVVTSATPVPVGQSVVMTGTVVLNKDFGSGYRYDILIEDGIIIQ